MQSPLKFFFLFILFRFVFRYLLFAVLHGSRPQLETEDQPVTVSLHPFAGTAQGKRQAGSSATMRVIADPTQCFKEISDGITARTG